MKESQKILSTAAELFFRYGIKSISMDDLSKELGMSKKTIYLYVENKKDLVQKTIEDHIAKSASQISLVFEDQSLNAIDQLMEVAKINHAILRKLNPSLVFDLKKYYKNCWAAIENHHDEFVTKYVKQNLKLGIKEGLYRNGLNVDIITKMYVSQLHQITNNVLFPPEQFNIANVYVEFLKYHVLGISTEKGVKYFNKIMIKGK